jgi:hypothetical protein
MNLGLALAKNVCAVLKFEPIAMRIRANVPLHVVRNYPRMSATSAVLHFSAISACSAVQFHVLSMSQKRK